MIVSDSEKRWLVIGIAINKVVAPVLRDVIKQGMDTHYTNLDTYCSGLTTPCTLATLTYHQFRADPNLRRLKFQNINNNLIIHRNPTSSYNYNVNSSVDLAKLYLHDKHLAEFSAFDESLDMTAILQLLQFNNYHPAAIFSGAIETSADAVRKDVRNKWGHFDVTEWTEAFFNNCFSKLETLVRSLGLTGGMEKNTLDQLSDWRGKGCQLCFGHAVDRDLLSLIQREVNGIIKDLALQSAQLFQVQQTAAVLQVRLDDGEVTRKKEMKLILERLTAIEKNLGEELLSRVQGMEEKVEQVEQRATKTDQKVDQLEQRATKTDQKVNQMGQGLSDRMNQLELRVESEKPEVLPFDVQSCRCKLAEHYKRTATVPTSVWSKKSAVNIHQIYTRLSWVKEEQTPAGSSRAELNHYTDMFTENKNGLPSNRILVQGQTGIGKSTFVKKLAMDWAELDENRLTDEQKAILKKFELAVVIDLKKVSKHQSLKDVISASHIFAEEDTVMKDGLLSYITQNQDKVLLVFDGYDEYHCASNSEIFEIFRGNKLRNCCVLITTRISKTDELEEFQNVHAEITGFSEEDRVAFMIRMLGSETQAEALRDHLLKRGVRDLARVPLLLLFFCTLWKKGKLQRFSDSKTKLYMAIVQYVLDHNEGKCSSNFRKVEDFKEILAEIGKVALECLLNDDHVFEYDQLSAAILCEESRIMGLLQVNEYAENIRPAGMVSFIHKSIQEFLAAWYITYRCVPKGNLGEINDRARTLDKCRSLENVFKFTCGLSDGGSVKVFEHLTSVRVCDSELDLSKTIPDEQSEKDVTPCNVTYKHWMFINLVYDSFNEVESKTILFRHCLNCTEGIIFLSPYAGRSISDIVPERKILDKVSVYGVVFYGSWVYEEMTALYECLEFLDCLHIPLKTTENSAAISVEELLKKFEASKCDILRCGFCCILHFYSGQSLFYFTKLKLWCDDHAKLFAENFTPSYSPSLCPEPSSLKFLRSLYIGLRVNEETVRSFRTIIRGCKSFRSIRMEQLYESALECLEQIPNPRTCWLQLRSVGGSLTSSEVLKLAGLLPRFNNLTKFGLNLGDCCPEAENKLVSSITHKTLEELRLLDFRLTPATAATLGRSLPEMSSLKEFCLEGRKGSTVQVEDMKALFGGFNKTFPSLERLVFSFFSLRGCLASLTERFPFFPSLCFVDLSHSNMDERDLRGLVCSLKSISNLRYLLLDHNPLGDKNKVESIVKQALPQVHLRYK